MKSEKAPSRAPATALIVIAVAFGPLLAAGRVRAQTGPAFVYVTKVDVKQLSNAVRITIVADGTINWRRDNDFLSQFFDFNPPYENKRVQRFQLKLSNCRSKVGSFTPVELYPVDYLEFAIPEDSRSGVGLDVTVVLDAEGHYGLYQSELNPGPGIMVSETPDRRSLTVVISSDRFPEQKPVHKTSSEVLGAPSLSVTAHDGRLDLAAANEPLSTVAQAMAAATGAHVIVQSDADRLVSAVIKDRPPVDILAMLVDAYGLDLSAQGGVLLITAGPLGETRSAGVTRTPLHYIDSRVALSLLPTFLLHYAHADPEHNALIISGSPSLRSRVIADLTRLDQPAPQCRITVTFVTYTHSSDFAQTLEIARRTSNSIVTLGAGSGGVPTGIAVYERQSEQSPGIDAALTALRQNSDLKVDARPSIFIQSGRTGTIFDGQTNYIVQSGSNYGGGGLQRIDVGTGLTVTPAIGDAGWLTLILSLRSSDLQSRDPITGLPTLESRTASDTVRLRSGDTLYLGGLTETQRESSHFKVPIIGDIPLLGRLFRGVRTNEEQIRLAVFVTATIVPETNQATPQTPRMRGAGGSSGPSSIGSQDIGSH